MSLSLPVSREAQGRTPRAPSLARAASVSTIEIARLTLVCGLVFIHYGAFPGQSLSAFHAFDLSDVPVASFLASGILYFFFSAVPILSLISGWLFFRERPGGSHAFANAMLRRGRTLLAPLLAWNMLAIAACLLAVAVGGDGWAKSTLHFEPASASAWQWFDALVGASRTPVALQFWFVHDLILAVLFSPLILLALRHAPWLVALLGVAWLGGADLVIFQRPDVLFFFCVGGLVRIYGVPRWGGRVPAAPLILLYLALVLARTAAPAFLDELEPSTAFWLDCATRAMRIVGVAAIWQLLTLVSQSRFGPWLAARSHFAFFIFAAHFPLADVVKRGWERLIPAAGEGGALLNYALSVTATIALSALAAVVLSRIAPNLFKLLSGGRAV